MTRDRYLSAMIQRLTISNPELFQSGTPLPDKAEEKEPVPENPYRRNKEKNPVLKPRKEKR